MPKLIVIYWDQLTESIPSFQSAKPSDHILFVECQELCEYVAHHKKKLVFLLSSMRHFYPVVKKKFPLTHYFELDHPENLNTIKKCVTYLAQNHTFDEIVVTQPGEYHQQETIKKVAKQLKTKLTLLEDTRFLCSKEAFSKWIGKKSHNQIVMESFYREMRKKSQFLMEGSEPIGGQWNFDKNNRKPIPKTVEIPHIPGFPISKITKKVIKVVEEKFPNHFGDINPFWYAVTHKDAEEALDRFIKIALPQFGDYQDAMKVDEAFIFHSILSQYINIGLLDPLIVCEKVEAEYYANHITLACAEGFIRQIIGWREFVRGIYWHFMPDYQELNVMNYQTKLPELYWGKPTKMACLSHTIEQTKKHAYSHHIQRLMVTGNFATLIGVHPKLIHEWYLIVYIDAFEWVEMPNTIGMATFSDGGIVGTKPYISGGNYINKMSDFCKNCSYKVQVKSGKEACPFNYLYWNYLIEHHKTIETNHRLRMPYNTLKKMTPERVAEIKSDSQDFLKRMNDGEVV